MGSHENWFKVMLLAINKDVLEVGVDHFRSARHPCSPLRRWLPYFSMGRVSRKTLCYAYMDVNHWSELWDLQILQLRLKRDPTVACIHPELWMAFVREHCIHLLKASHPVDT